MNRRGFAPIEILAIVMVLGAIILGGVYLFSHNQIRTQAPINQTAPAVPTSSVSVPTSTSAWSTYKNGEYGFSFEYPTDFRVDVQTSSDNNAELTLEVHTKQQPPADALGQDIRMEYAGYYLDIYSASSGPQIIKQIGNDAKGSCLFPIEPVSDFSKGVSDCKETIQTAAGSGMAYVVGGASSPIGAYYEGYLKTKNLVVSFYTYQGYDADLKHILNSFSTGNLSNGHAQTINASLKELFAAGISEKCMFFKGTVYITAGHMRGDFTPTTSAGTFTSHMITDGVTEYVWTDRPAQGIKMSFMKANPVSLPSSEVNPDSRFDYSCSGWSVDQSEFTLPSGITFMDINEVLNGGNPPVGK